MTWEEAMRSAWERAIRTNRHQYVRGYRLWNNGPWRYRVYAVGKKNV